jgi:hypothetical protein
MCLHDHRKALNTIAKFIGNPKYTPAWTWRCMIGFRELRATRLKLAA